MRSRAGMRSSLVRALGLAGFLIGGFVVCCGGLTPDDPPRQTRLDSGSTGALDAATGALDATTGAVDAATGALDAATAEDGDRGLDAIASDAETGTPFTPAALSDLMLWLSADVGVTAVNGRVSRWEDRSPAHEDATPDPDPDATSDSAPFLIADALSGRHVIRFDGSSYLALPPGFADFTRGLSAFVVTRPFPNRPSGQRYFDFSGTKDSPSDSILLGRWRDTESLLYQVYDGNDGVDYVNAVNVITEGTFQQLAVVAPAGAAESRVEASLYCNDESKASSRVKVPRTFIRQANYIGRSNYAGQNDPFLEADIAEIILFARALSDTERVQVGAYLKTKWGL